jgi:two-component system, NarL family, sensor kinase
MGAALIGVARCLELWRVVNRQRSDATGWSSRRSPQEAERRPHRLRLASVSLHLSAAELTVADLATAGATGEPELRRARAELVCARGLADVVCNWKRTAISGLRSLVLDDPGLVAAIEFAGGAGRAWRRTEFELVVAPEAGTEPIPDQAAVLYHITQEGLGNAVQLGEAGRIVLSRRRGLATRWCWLHR